MKRNPGAEPFFAVGGTNFDAANAAAFGARVGENGSPQFTDVNGKVHEIRSSKDVDLWRTTNAVGRPRLKEVKNPVTGERTWVPLTTGGVRFDPVTGEPETQGETIRESAKLVQLDNADPPMPSESRTGRPLKNGVLVNDDPVSRHVDPVTGKRMKMSELWGGSEGFGSNNQPAMKALPRK